MKNWRVKRLVCTWTCLVVITLLDYISTVSTRKICSNRTQIANTVYKHVFSDDIIESNGIDKTKRIGNTYCFSMYSNGDLVITADEKAVKIHGQQGGQMTSESTERIMDNNSCDSIPRNEEQLEINSLTVKNTYISEIHSLEFASWSHIESLKIDSNNFLYRIENNAFHGLTNVWKLEIINNGNLSYLEEGSLEGLINLKGLFLQRNNITHIAMISKALTLKRVPNLVHLDLSGNSILVIEKNDFLPMKGIQLYGLVLGQTKTVDIHPNALDPFGEHLVDFRFTRVNVNTSTMVKFINQTTKANKNLVYLILHENLFCGSPHELLQVVSNSAIAIDLGGNHFGLMKPGFFPVMNKLKYLDMTNVMMDEIPDGIINSTVLPELRHFYAPGNMITKLTKSMITSSLTRLDLSSIPQDKDDTGQIITDFKIEANVLKLMPRLQLLNLIGNKINKITPLMFEHALELTVLLLRRTSLTSIQNRSFEMNEKIYYLDLAENMFPMVTTLTGEIFYGLNNLLVLDLSNCYISSLSNDLFDYIPNLQYLSLRANPIAKLSPFVFAAVPHLKILDLRYNILVSWQQEIFTDEHCLQKFMLNYNNIMKMTKAMLADFEKVDDLNLYANSISCDCDLYQNVIDLKINTSKSIYLKNTKCSYPPALNSTMYKFLLLPLYECVSYKKAIIACSVMFSIIILLVLILLYFKYKYDVQYFLLRMKKKFGIANIYRTKKGKVNRGFFKYDAFVSYSAHDSNFVEKMMMILEKDGSKYKLCVFERDFQPGDNLVDRILECMEVSMVTILILTEAFAKSEWCRWEMTIAQNKVISQHFLKDSLILIIKSNISESLMTPTLKYLMDTRVYLEWHEHSSVRQNIFWEKLKDALKEKIQEPKMPLPNLTTCVSCDHNNSNTDETVT